MRACGFGVCDREPSVVTAAAIECGIVP